MVLDEQGSGSDILNGRKAFVGVEGQNYNVTEMESGKPDTTDPSFEQAFSKAKSVFPLTKNTMTLEELVALRKRCLIDESKYRTWIAPSVTSMSATHIPIPLAHFDAGLRLPLDPGFVDFLHVTETQPAHIHPNAVRYIMSLIALGRRINIEISVLLIMTFFSPVPMVEDCTFSIRPCNDKVSLFGRPIPDKDDWKNKWILVESRTGFPFPPFTGNLVGWKPVIPNTRYSEYEKEFLRYVEERLGSDPKCQKRIFSTEELISERSLMWCGISGTSEKIGSEIRALRRLEETEEYPLWTLHPNRVFSSECPICTNETSIGCQPLTELDVARQRGEHYPFTIFAELFDFVYASKKKFEAQIEELKQSNETMKMEIVKLNKDIEWYKSEEFKNQVVDDFRGSDEYKTEVSKKAYVFMNSGATHMVRRIHHFFKDKTPLLQAYNGLYHERDCRGGSDFVPYTEEELKLISKFDQSNGKEPWQPPPPTNPTFFDMLKVFSPAASASTSDSSKAKRVKSKGTGGNDDK